MGATAGGWRYWADGLELASVGHVPSVTLQWGALSAPAVSKLAANAWNGELSFLLLRHPFAAMAASLWLSAAGYVAGLWALGWEAGLRRTAPLLPLLGVAGSHLPLVSVNPDIVTKLQFFQDEDMGRTLAVIACAVAFAAMRERRGRTAPAVAGALLAAAALTHLIPVIAACALLVPYAIAFGVASRSLGRGIAVAVWTIGLAGLVTVASLFASGANLGFQGASGGAGYTDYRGRYDPTLAFKGVLAPPRPKAIHRWYEPPTTTAHAYLDDALGRRAGGWRLSFVAVALVAVAAVAVALGPYDLRALAIAAAAMGLLLLAVALAFSYHYAYYIQATFGERRLLEYGALPILLLVLAALESVLDRVAAFDGRAAAVAAVALLLAVLAAAAGDLRGGLGGLGPNADFVNAARIATPCDARILPDISTRGSFQALTGRASLLEGLAPFLGPPSCGGRWSSPSTPAGSCTTRAATPASSPASTSTTSWSTAAAASAGSASITRPACAWCGRSAAFASTATPDRVPAAAAPGPRTRPGTPASREHWHEPAPADAPAGAGRRRGRRGRGRRPGGRAARQSRPRCTHLAFDRATSSRRPSRRRAGVGAGRLSSTRAGSRAAAALRPSTCRPGSRARRRHSRCRCSCSITSAPAASSWSPSASPTRRSAPD